MAGLGGSWNKSSISDFSTFIKRVYGGNTYIQSMVNHPYSARVRAFGARAYQANTFRDPRLANVFGYRNQIYKHNAKVALKYGVAGAAVGMTIYGMTSAVGNRRKTKAGRAFARTSYYMGRTAAVPAHFVYGGVKGALSPMSQARFFDVRAGARRALRSAEGYNVVTNRKSTMYARQRRQTIRRNRKARAGHQYQNTPPKLTKQQRQQAARKRRRVKGKFA